jgi:hypothetical protein
VVNDGVRRTRLAIDEVSAVDRPANMLDGWAILKARGELTPEAAALQKALDAEGITDPERRISYLKAVRTEVAKLVLAAPAPTRSSKWRHGGASLV